MNQANPLILDHYHSTTPWTDFLAPRSASEMLHNKECAEYLRDWLKALALQLHDAPEDGDKNSDLPGSSPPAVDDDDESEQIRSGKKRSRPLPTTKILRVVEKRRKRRKVASDDGDGLDGFMVADDALEQEEDAETVASELHFGSELGAEDELPGTRTATSEFSSPIDEGNNLPSSHSSPLPSGTRSRPRRRSKNVIVSSPPDSSELDGQGQNQSQRQERDTVTMEKSSPPPKPYDTANNLKPNTPLSAFLSSQNLESSDDPPVLTNTLLLQGPSGSGKTASIYACAQELGWDVFEVYPGIGKRSGSAVSSLVGDVGRNHIVGGHGFSSGSANASAAGAFSKLFGGQMSTGSSIGFMTSPSKKKKSATSPETTDVSGSTSTPENTVRQSLILLEEVDILYQTDTNFWPSVINLIKNSRRPVIMTCNGTSHNHPSSDPYIIYSCI